jgi:hypothetical protein
LPPTIGHLAKDDERVPETVRGSRVVVFACLMLQCLLTAAAQWRQPARNVERLMPAHNPAC